MVNPELSSSHSPEIPQPKLDALIVPGKNIGVRHSPSSLDKQYKTLLDLGMTL